MSEANTIIDTENKYLIDQFNAVETALNTKENHNMLVKTLEHLIGYTKTHFDHAETLPRKIRYPDFAEHKKIMPNLYSIKNKLDSILGTDKSEND